MHPAFNAIVRRFPLTGRPRPACPALTDRISSVTARLHTAGTAPEAASAALNELALIASDCRLPGLARQLCWQHIDAYRRLDRPLTTVEAQYMLEPVVNLARLMIRGDDGDPAVALLEAIHNAIGRRIDLTVSGRNLPTGSLIGGQQSWHQLRGWVWQILVSEGVRALALAGRWADATQHATRHRGIGDHLMEGRQAAIIAAHLGGRPEKTYELLAGTTATYPWERDVLDCLHLLCGDPREPTSSDRLAAATRRYALEIPGAQYASYHARLGVTLALIAQTTDGTLAASTLHHAAETAIHTGDGYAARDLLAVRDQLKGITMNQGDRLTRLVAAAGLNGGPVPVTVLARLVETADKAAAFLAAVR